MKRIAERMKAFRKTKGISQKALAEGTGMSVTTINKMEKGGDVMLSNIVKVEEVLGVKLF